MTGSVMQKKALAQRMAAYFSKQGYLVSPQDFSNDPNRPELISVPTIRKIFNSWSIMLANTKSFCPELMRGLTEEKPKETVNPLEELQAKTAKAE